MLNNKLKHNLRLTFLLSPYLALALIIGIGFIASNAQAIVPGNNEAIAVDTSGGLPNNTVYLGENSHNTSQDGRFVVFHSQATDLVTSPTPNGKYQIYLNDRLNNTTSLVSISSGGVIGNNDSSHASVSDDGRYIVFGSTATNLVSGDTNATSDVFIHDRVAGTTQLVSKSAANVIGNSDSTYPRATADGKFIVFLSNATNLVTSPTITHKAVFVKNMSTGEVKLVSKSASGNPNNALTSFPQISCEGRIVTFQTYANNILPSDTTNPSKNVTRIYVVDLMQSTISPDSILGDSPNTIAYGNLSCNGNYVGFTSTATNIVASDTNGLQDSFVYNRIDGSIIRVSLDSSGNQATGGGSSTVSVSSDGKYATFYSSATNLVSGDTNGYDDIFLRNIQAGTTELISKNSTGTIGNSYSNSPVISSDGRYVTYISNSNNLVSGYSNTTASIFTSQTGTGNDY